MKAWAAKDPDELIAYGYDWSLDLAEGETISAHQTVIDNAAGTSIVTDTADASSTTLRISGGNDGETAQFTLRITTSTGQIFEDTVTLPIRIKVAPAPPPTDYTEPTAANLIFVFPEFADLSTAQIDYYLARAATYVDESWSEADFAYAQILLAAHLMTSSGLGKTAEAQAVSSGSGEFRSMAIGSLRLDRFEPSKSMSGFSTTRYGREFQVLQRRNRGGPRVTGGLAHGWGDGDMSQRGPWS